VRPETSLSQRVAKGGLWIFTFRLVDNGFRVVKLVILARLLAPKDFGLFGIALLAISTLETFSQTGFQTALVQKKANIAHYLDTAWTVSAIRGTFLFILLFLSAPSIALFFNTPDAFLIIQVIGASILLNGFNNIAIVYLQKELEFSRQFIYQLSVTLADFIVVIAVALAFKNVWALVFGLLAGNTMGLIVSYVVHPYRPRLRLDIRRIKDLFGFGRWIFGSSILAFLITQGDDAFVGKFLGATMLGFYQMAYKIANMPTTEITQVISQVTFPAYSKIQDNLPRLREAYARVLQLTAFLSFPIAGLIFALASDFTKVFLGERWMPMVPAMQVLVLWGLIRSIGTATGQVFLSIGKPEIVAKLQFIVLILLGILIYPLSIKWGILGTSLAVLVSTFAPNFIAFLMIIRTLQYAAFNLVRMIVIPLINTMLLIILIALLRVYWIHPGIEGLFLSVIFGSLLYIGMTLLCINFFNYKVFENIKMGIYALRHSSERL